MPNNVSEKPTDYINDVEVLRENLFDELFRDNNNKD